MVHSEPCIACIQAHQMLRTDSRHLVGRSRQLQTLSGAFCIAWEGRKTQLSVLDWVGLVDTQSRADINN